MKWKNRNFSLSIIFHQIRTVWVGTWLWFLSSDVVWLNGQVETWKSRKSMSLKMRIENCKKDSSLNNFDIVTNWSVWKLEDGQTICKCGFSLSIESKGGKVIRCAKLFSWLIGPLYLVTQLIALSILHMLYKYFGFCFGHIHFQQLDSFKSFFKKIIVINILILFFKFMNNFSFTVKQHVHRCKPIYSLTDLQNKKKKNHLFI